MQTTETDPRRRAYAAGASIAHVRIEREAPLDAQALRAVEASDIVVVRGCYDHVEWVLDALGTPFTPADPAHLEAITLRPSQLLVVNCPGDISRAAATKVREFVGAGGSLFTTDWALRHVLEPAFPGVLAYNERPTADDVVRIELAAHDNPFLRGVIDPGDDPQWWLEGSSYPIRVLDPSVDVIVRSAELEARYGEAAVAVHFRHGDGEVFHMISHYYLQRTELRDQRHASKATSYFEEKGVIFDTAEIDGLNLSDVESAATSARFLANVVGAKKRRG